MDIKKLTHFVLSTLIITLVILVTTIMNWIPYPFNITLDIALLVLLVFTAVRFLMSSKKADPAKFPQYTYNSSFPVAITISPFRVQFFSLVMIIFSSLMILFFLNGLVTTVILRSGSFPIIGIGMILLFSFVLFSGIRLYQRRNDVVQLKIDNTGIEYFPVDIYGTSRGSGAAALSMYFKKKMIRIDYSDISEISMIHNQWQGDHIYLVCKSQSHVNLPFLPNDPNHMKAVYQFMVTQFENYRTLRNQ